MLVSFRWLQELCPVDADVAEVSHRISLAGLEVEAMDEKGSNLSGVVIAEVRTKSPHTKKDKLTLVTVFDGEDEHEVVCGAPNVPEPGGRILFARSGAVLPNGIEIAPRKVGGVESNGMICSEAELEIGTDAEGIFVVDSDTGALPGTSVADALDLDETRARLLQRALASETTSLDQDLPGAQSDLSLASVIRSRDAERPESVVFDRMQLRMLSDLLESIDEREGRILALRFGLDPEGPKTLREVGRQVGLSRERVRQIEKRALEKLKEAMASAGFG